MVKLNNEYHKIENPESIKKFLLESFIYENNFNIFYKNFHYSGILLKLEYNNEDALVIRFPRILPDDYKKGNEYKLEFNNSRGKFYTNIVIKDILIKGNRSFIISNFPHYLYRLQRRNSIRTIPDYINKPIIVRFIQKDTTSELKVRDIGLDGFSITLSKDTSLAAQKIGTIFDIELNFPDSNYKYKSKAKLIHGSTILNKYRAGFQIIDVEPNLKNEIINYLVVRRIEIKNKILQKEKSKDIYEHLGEWLDNFLKYDKDKFKDFKLAVITNDDFLEKINFLSSYYPSTRYFTSIDFDRLKNFSPYLVVFHITQKTKSKWYKYVKIREFQYTPTILISKDTSILHLLKEKSFYSAILKEDEINDKLVDTIAKFSNVLIPHVFLDSLQKKPNYDGEEKKVAIIDNSVFGFSSKIILEGINFKVDLYNNISEFFFKKDGYEIIIFDPTLYDYQESLEKIFELNKNFRNIILTFPQIEPYFSKFNNFFSDLNLLIKPFRYNNLISKVMAFKDNIEEKPLIKGLVVNIISTDKEFHNFFENLFKNLFQDGSFELVDYTHNFTNINREEKVFINLNSSYDFNFLKRLVNHAFKQKNELIGVIYKPIHKKLLMNYLKIGIKKIIIADDSNKFFEKFKEYYFYS